MAKMRTYDEWLKKGRHVRLGEKAKDRDDFGQALFSKRQTDKTEHREFPYDDHYLEGGMDYDYDDCRSYGSLGDTY